MMKKHLKKLIEIKDSIEHAIDNRESYFDNKTKKWQESEKGEFYQYKTNDLAEVFRDIDTAIYNLTQFIA